ncbi:MAG: UDP-3-O-(3-hydroxymyristoyl)glucosamine N-acyltransferase [Pseudomonadota bacterium]
MTKSLAELAAMVEGEVVGDSLVPIFALNDVESAGPGEITFITKAKLADKLATSKASAVIVPLDIGDVPLPAIRVKNPNLAAALIHNLFYQRPLPFPGIHGSAQVGADCFIPPSVSIAPLAVVGNRVTLGKDVIVESGVVIGDDVDIGDKTILEANAVVRHGCKIGSRVIVNSGAVIGRDGFGFATDQRGDHIKRPQVGNVVIEDDVEIGANSCVDRATFGTTRIGRGTKIDNLVQIGHNVEIGPSCIIVSQSGVAGSSKVGGHVVMGGQAGIGDHVEVGDGVMIAGRSGVNGNVASGRVVAGFPAINYKDWLQAATAFSRIPQLLKDVRGLRKKVDELAGQCNVKEEENE